MGRKPVTNKTKVDVLAMTRTNDERETKVMDAAEATGRQGEPQRAEGFLADIEAIRRRAGRRGNGYFERRGEGRICAARQGGGKSLGQAVQTYQPAGWQTQYETRRAVVTCRIAVRRRHEPHGHD